MLILFSFRAFFHTNMTSAERNSSDSLHLKNALKVAVINYSKQTMGGFPQDDDFY